MGKPSTKIDMSNGLPTTYKPYVNYHLNPEPLTATADGGYIRSQLEERKRRYEALRSFIYGKKGQITVIKKRIESREESNRSRYRQLMNKAFRTREELEELYARTHELEAFYNQIPLLEAQIRGLERELITIYPEEQMKIVYKELDEVFDPKQLEEKGEF